MICISTCLSVKTFNPKLLEQILPYGSAGMCIINYAPPEINVIMAKAMFDCSSQCQRYITIREIQAFGVVLYSLSGHLVPCIAAVKDPHPLMYLYN